MSSFNTIEEAIEDFKQGKMLVVVDDKRRENEGDLIIAAEKITPQAINFMAKHGGGLICMPIIKEQLVASGIPAAMIDKIMVGKTNKYYEEVCLLNQKYIKQDSGRV